MCNEISAEGYWRWEGKPERSVLLASYTFNLMFPDEVSEEFKKIFTKESLASAKFQEVIILKNKSLLAFSYFYSLFPSHIQSAWISKNRGGGVEAGRQGENNHPPPTFTLQTTSKGPREKGLTIFQINVIIIWNWTFCFLN